MTAPLLKAFSFQTTSLSKISTALQMISIDAFKNWASVLYVVFSAASGNAMSQRMQILLLMQLKACMSLKGS